jgi:hypothetical protein
MEDGEPFVCSDKEAWVFSGGLWKRERLPEVGMNGRVMSKEAFDAVRVGLNYQFGYTPVVTK